jgi:hypothetical protein
MTLRYRTAITCVSLTLIGMAVVSAQSQNPAQIVAQIKSLLDQLVTPTGGQNQPLIQSSNLQIIGVFRVAESLGAADGCGFSFSVGPMASSGRGTLYVANHCGNVAELTIPATMTVSATLSALPVATTLVQSFADPTEGHYNPTGTSGTFPSGLGGLLVLPDGRLHEAGYVYYDANNAVTVSQGLRSGTLSAPSFSGWFPLTATWTGRPTGSQMQGYVGGGMTAVPAVWQAVLGGTALASGWGLPIISRTSSGPDAFAFDPTSQTPTGTMLLGYPGGHEALGTYAGVVGQANPAFNMATGLGSLAIVPGWRTLLAFERTGLGVDCYGPATGNVALVGTPVSGAPGEVWCLDPYVSDKGGHAYPNGYYVLAYDLNDLAAVKVGTKAPWDVLPYAQWPLVLPLAEPSFKLIGATVDAATGTIYLLQAFADVGSGFFSGPIFYAMVVK